LNQLKIGAHAKLKVARGVQMALEWLFVATLPTGNCP